jgi:hypothetical protein
MATGVLAVREHHLQPAFVSPHENEISYFPAVVIEHDLTRSFVAKHLCYAILHRVSVAVGSL